MRFRSKPSEVEAVQWTGDFGSSNECIRFVGCPDGVDYGFVVSGMRTEAWLRAGKNGSQGWMPVPIGYWIVRQPGDRTDHWSVDPNYFADKYEPVEEAS